MNDIFNERKEKILAWEGFKNGKVIKENRKDMELIIKMKDKSKWRVELMPWDKPGMIKITCLYVEI